MDYSDNPKVVFIAIPKTGTRSVVDYMKTHLCARRYPDTRTHEEIVPAALKKHFAFTVVRNPYDRMISYWWSTCMREGGAGHSLEEFLKRPIQPNIREFQHPYIERNRIDKVIHFENLVQEFKQLPFYIKGTEFGWLNPTIKPSTKHPNPRPPTSELLTPEVQNTIATKFAKDFEVCGYSIDYEADK